MENASKALIMAATVLLGLMIISIGVALFNTFSEFSKDTIEKMDEKKIAEWNNQFLKYYGKYSTLDTDKKVYITKDIEVTAHDIITVANLSKKNNENYELTVDSSGNKNTYYVQVKVNNAIIDGKEKNIVNFENLSESDKNKFLQENSLIIQEDENQNKTVETKYYECTRVEISDVTKKVMYIEFKEYDNK